jgi:hypothetical protein
MGVICKNLLCVLLHSAMTVAARNQIKPFKVLINPYQTTRWHHFLYSSKCNIYSPNANVSNQVRHFRSASLGFCIILWTTSLSRVLFEQLTFPQLIKKFPTFCRTRKFITVFTTARHFSLS